LICAYIVSSAGTSWVNANTMRLSPSSGNIR
jgi:hypothetical protein